MNFTARSGVQMEEMERVVRCFRDFMHYERECIFMIPGFEPPRRKTMCFVTLPRLPYQQWPMWKTKDNMDLS